MRAGYGSRGIVGLSRDARVEIPVDWLRALGPGGAAGHFEQTPEGHRVFTLYNRPESKVQWKLDSFKGREFYGILRRRDTVFRDLPEDLQFTFSEPDEIVFTSFSGGPAVRLVFTRPLTPPLSKLKNRKLAPKKVTVEVPVRSKQVQWQVIHVPEAGIQEAVTALNLYARQPGVLLEVSPGGYLRATEKHGDWL